MFDCNSFINRKGWKQRELAQRLNIGTSTVGMWCTGQSTPSYGVILKLIELGMTMEELFGSNVSEMLMENSVNLNQSKTGTIFDSPEFRESVEKILREISMPGGSDNG